MLTNKLLPPLINRFLKINFTYIVALKIKAKIKIKIVSFKE